MDRDRPPAEPSPLVLESVLKAAEVARIGVSVSVLEPGGSTCVYATEMAAALLGATLPTLVGHSLRDFIAPEDVEQLSALAKELITDPQRPGSIVEVNAIRPGGERVALELAYAPITVAGKPAVVTFLSNVGEQRDTENRVRETAHRLAQIVDQAPDAIVISRHGVILEANPAAAKMLGLAKAQDLVGQSLAQFVVGEDGAVMRDRMASVARGESPGPPRVYRATSARGDVLLVEIASFASEYGGAPAVIAFGRDVTARERLQEELARTERLAALGTLAAGVAHEINNPLAALALNAEVVERAVSRATLREQDRELGATAMAELKRAVERMTAIVRDLTGFSRVSTEQAGPVEVAAVVERALRVAWHATRQRAAIRLELAAVPAVSGSAGKLEQVLVNLVVNAAQAFPADRGEGQNEIVIRTFLLDPQRVALEVCDNGAGIPAEVVGQVFDPFFTTKPAGVGTGLGLFICHNAVRQMDGEIVIDSAPGRGTTMRVILRRAAEGAAVQVPAAGPAPALSKARGRVLIIDDEPALCRTLQILLRDNHDVTTAPGGKEALLTLDSGAVFDVFVCDLMMPGFTGMEFFARLQKERPGLEKRIIFMTGGAFTDAAGAFLSACPNPRLQKPFTAETLDSALQQVLRDGPADA